MADGKLDRRGKYVEVETALLNEFEQLPAKNGTTFRFELEDAMRRHLKFPPKREPEPLPDAAGPADPPADQPKKKRGK